MEPVTKEVLTRHLITEVKELLSGPFGWSPVDFDLIYRPPSEPIGRVLVDADLVFETGTEDGTRVIVNRRAGNDEDHAPMASGITDPWELTVFELVPQSELERLRTGTEHANDVELIIASVVHGGLLNGMGGM
jgi:hypothetical protein